MNIIDGPSIANLCDYDFGDQAGCLGGVPNAFMEDANEGNTHFLKTVNGHEYMTLYIDNIRLYKRPIKCGTPFDQERVNHMMEKDDLLHLLAEIS